MGRKLRGELRIADVSRSRPGRLGPLLAYFQHAPLDPSSLSSSSPSVLLEEVGGRVGVKVTSGTMSYSGTSSSPNMTTYLAVRDRATGKTRLVEASSVSLAPGVAPPPPSNPMLLEKVEEEKTWKERLAASKHLIKSFGQAKGGRFYEQQERMRIEEGQAQERVSLAATREDTTKQATGEDDKEQEASLAPPRHPEATRPEDVYRVEELLTKGELADLAEAASTLLEGGEGELAALAKAKQLSKLGLALLSKAREAREPREHNKAALVLYMEGCIRFTRLRPGDLRKGTKALQDFLPISVRRKILADFSTLSGSDRLVSPELADRAKCYSIVFALLATNLSVDVSALTESMFVRPDHLRKLVGVVGARTEGDPGDQTQRIVLRLPLATFRMEMMRARKNKK